MLPFTNEIPICSRGTSENQPEFVWRPSRKGDRILKRVLTARCDACFRHLCRSCRLHQFCRATREAFTWRSASGDGVETELCSHYSPGGEEKDRPGNGRHVYIVHTRVAFKFVEACPLWVGMDLHRADKQILQPHYDLCRMVSQVLNLQLAWKVHHHKVRPSTPFSAIPMGRSDLSCLRGTFPVLRGSSVPSAPSCGPASACGDPAGHETLRKRSCLVPRDRGLARS